MSLGKSTFLAEGINPGSDRGTSNFDGLLEYSLEDFYQPFYFGPLQGVHGLPWIQTGSEKTFIHIDIPQTSDQGLVQQCGFQWPRSPDELSFKIIWTDFQGIRTQVSPAAREKLLTRAHRPEATEPSWIDEMHLEAS